MDKLYRLKDVAEMLSVSEHFLSKRVSRPGKPALKLPALEAFVVNASDKRPKFRFTQTAVDRFLAQLQNESAEK